MTERQFIAKLKTVLQNNRIDKIYDREKSGLINEKRLGLFGSTDKVFKKRSQEKLEKDYSISILLDCSGSMNQNGRFGKSLKSCLQLARSFEKTGINYEITIFSEFGIVLKSFGEELDEERITKDHEIFSTRPWVRVFSCVNEKKNGYFSLNQPPSSGNLYVNSSDFGANNYDGYVIYNTSKRLRNEKGKKMMLVLSDGSPSHPGSFPSHLIKTLNEDRYETELYKIHPITAIRRAINTIKKQGITVIGMGIETEYVKEIYPISFVVNSDEDMFRKSIATLNKVITKI